MTDAPPAENQPNPAPGLNVQRRLALAWLSLTWERLWTRLWIPATLLMLFIALVITDVLPSLHWVAHTLVVLAVAAGLGFLLWRRLKDFAFPTRNEARVRLETTSPVVHRPLTTVEDSLAAGADAVQQWLWRIHQQRARADVDRLRVKGPAPGIASRDRFALRAAVVLALFVAVVGGWGDISNRIWRGLLPMFGGADSRVSVKVWVTPPAYTSRSPLYLEVPAPEGIPEVETLDVPAGSKALAVVTGTTRGTSLVQDESSTSLDKLSDATQRGEVELKATTRLEVRQSGRELAGWDVNWLVDQAPEITFAGPPSEAPRWRIRLDYRAVDDYGLRDLTARVTRADAPDGEALEFPVSLPLAVGKTIIHSSVHDLASHPWAGQKVSITLTATDHANQSATSKAMVGLLPEREFIHPVSKELAKFRKLIMTRAEEAKEPALKYVTETLKQPGSFGGDHMVTLTLATAKYRMAYETTAEVEKGVPDLLWHAAVRIEDGSLVAAEQRMLAAEKALRDALERGASPEEINKLVDELQQAVADYAKALQEKNPDQNSDFAQGDQTSPEDIASSLEELRQMSEVGAEDAAKQALQNLQDQLQALRDQAQQGGGKNPEVKRAEEMLKEMRDLAKAESELLNENFDQAKQQAAREQRDQQRQAQERQQGRGQMGRNKQAEQESEKEAQAQSMAGRKAADKQEAVRKQLNQLMDRMQQMTGQKPEGVDDADQAMQDARDALNAGAFKAGVEQQSKALTKLQQSMAQVQEQLMEALFERGLGGAMKLPGAGEMGFSKLGSRDGRRSDGGVKVPEGPDTAGMAQRVRAIMDEIRKRASDRTRPETEQEYLRRLMKPF